jgi:hypothetical protein
MGAAEAIKIIQVLVSLLQLAQVAGVNIQQVTEMVKQAQAQGRDLTEAEMQQLFDAAQNAIDQARNA